MANREIIDRLNDLVDDLTLEMEEREKSEEVRESEFIAEFGEFMEESGFLLNGVGIDDLGAVCLKCRSKLFDMWYQRFLSYFEVGKARELKDEVENVIEMFATACRLAGSGTGGEGDAVKIISRGKRAINTALNEYLATVGKDFKGVGGATVITPQSYLLNT